MCGLVTWQGKQEVSPDRFSSCVERLYHRGPDDSGQWHDEGTDTGFSHRRLSIIDLETGQQPIVRDGFAIAYNGEIYNFRSLRKKLSRSGYEFFTKSDTEVFLQGYREWNTEVFDRVRGMFSVSIWDPREEELTLARDPVGQKPLFYADDEEFFLAASELQALLAQPELAHSADFASLSWYLSLGYIPSPRTAFSKIKQIPPGHYMKVKGGQIKDQVRYWDPMSIRREAQVIDTDEVIPAIRETVRSAVRRRMVSDVPLGAFLSGGIDSSLIVALMQDHSDEPIKTISVGFEDDRYDERDYAHLAADRAGTDHRGFTMNINLEDILPRLVRHFGQPFADSSAVPSFYLSKKTRELVKVAVSGDGGDEVFGGYRRYRAMRVFSFFNRFLPDSLGSAIGALSRTLGTPSDRRSTLGEVNRVLQVLGSSPVKQYLSMVGIMGDRWKKILAKGPLQRPACRGGEQWLGRLFRRLSGDLDTAQIVMSVDMVSYLPEDLLVKTDITSMMNSLEVRCPFLDRDLLELSLKIPSREKIGWNQSKIALKRAFADQIPEEIRERPKMGFAVPLSRWFRTGPESSYLRDRLLDKEGSFFSVIDRQALEKLHTNHVEKKLDAAPFLWAVLIMKIWMNQFEVRI